MVRVNNPKNHDSISDLLKELKHVLSDNTRLYLKEQYSHVLLRYKEAGLKGTRLLRQVLSMMLHNVFFTDDDKALVNYYLDYMIKPNYRIDEHKEVLKGITNAVSRFCTHELLRLPEYTKRVKRTDEYRDLLHTKKLAMNISSQPINKKRAKNEYRKEIVNTIGERYKKNLCNALASMDRVFASKATREFRQKLIGALKQNISVSKLIVMVEKYINKRLSKSVHAIPCKSIGILLANNLVTMRYRATFEVTPATLLTQARYRRKPG